MFQHILLLSRVGERHLFVEFAEEEMDVELVGSAIFEIEEIGFGELVGERDERSTG